MMGTGDKIIGYACFVHESGIILNPPPEAAMTFNKEGEIIPSDPKGFMKLFPEHDGLLQ